MICRKFVLILYLLCTGLLMLDAQVLKIEDYLHPSMYRMNWNEGDYRELGWQKTPKVVDWEAVLVTLDSLPNISKVSLVTDEFESWELLGDAAEAIYCLSELPGMRFYKNQSMYRFLLNHKLDAEEQEEYHHEFEWIKGKEKDPSERLERWEWFVTQSTTVEQCEQRCAMLMKVVKDYAEAPEPKPDHEYIYEYHPENRPDTSDYRAITYYILGAVNPGKKQEEYWTKCLDLRRKRGDMILYSALRLANFYQGPNANKKRVVELWKEILEDGKTNAYRACRYFSATQRILLGLANEGEHKFVDAYFEEMFERYYQDSLICGADIDFKWNLLFQEMYDHYKKKDEKKAARWREYWKSLLKKYDYYIDEPTNPDYLHAYWWTLKTDGQEEELVASFEELYCSKLENYDSNEYMWAGFENPFIDLAHSKNKKKGAIWEQKHLDLAKKYAEAEVVWELAKIYLWEEEKNRGEDYRDKLVRYYNLSLEVARLRGQREVESKILYYGIIAFRENKRFVAAMNWMVELYELREHYPYIYGLQDFSYMNTIISYAIKQDSKAKQKKLQELLEAWQKKRENYNTSDFPSFALRNERLTAWLAENINALKRSQKL